MRLAGGRYMISDGAVQIMSSSKTSLQHACNVLKGQFHEPRKPEDKKDITVLSRFSARIYIST